jgi:hypothetical protein
MIALVAGLVIMAGALVRAEDEPQPVKGQVQQYDAKQGILKVKVGEQEKTFKVRADTKFVDQEGKEIDIEKQTEQVAPGAQVTLVVQRQGGKQGPQQVSRVQVQVIKIKKKPKPEPEPKQGPKPKPDPKQKPPAKPEQGKEDK